MALRSIALLRGINVGGKHSLPMKELAALFGKAGAMDVETFIQSGNVVFGAAAGEAAGIVAEVQRGIRAKFGFEAPITLRSAADLAKIVKGNPYVGKEPASLHVAFLREKPAPALAKSLLNPGVDGEEFRLKGSEIYLCFPKGLAKTKVTNAYLDSKLKTISTLRNWRTTLALLELAQGGKA